MTYDTALALHAYFMLRLSLARSRAEIESLWSIKDAMVRHYHTGRAAA